jgi:6-phosphofructokinase
MAKLIGNLVVGQSGGPTAVINSTLAGVLHEALLAEEVGEIYGMVNGIQGLLDEEMYDLRRQPTDLVATLRATPSSALGACRHKLKEGDTDRVLKVLKAHNIRYFLYIGGNDSADTSRQVERAASAQGYDIRVIALPKTVDNDLPVTDHCPGYGSVARFTAIATMEAGADNRSMRAFDKVKIVEAMGRDSGWIAAASALGKREESDPPHLVYVPEEPLEMEPFLSDVRRVYDLYGYATVVVSESVRGADGRPFVESAADGEVDAFGHRQRGGVAEYLAGIVTSRLGLKARADKPGTLQRASMALASRVDLDEAFMVGVEGVRAAHRGVSGKMVILVRDPGVEYRCRTGLADLSEVALGVRLLPPEFMDFERHMPTPEFHAYAMPLVGDPLPKYATFRETRVPKLLSGR